VKLLSLLFFSGFLASGATASVSVTFTVNTLVVTDLQSFLETQIQATGSLAANVAMLDTTFTLATGPGAAIPISGTIPASGGALVIDAEIMTYTAFNPVTSTFTGLGRGTNVTNAANNTTAATHASGALVKVLIYPTVVSWIKATMLAQTRAAVLSLGPASAYVGGQKATVNTTEAAIETNLQTAVQ
jgi:hypothetical protein